MIVILDYGMGNLNSVLNMIHKAGGNAVISADHEKIDNADAVILPGVGSFDNGMEKLKSSGLLEVVKNKVLVEKTPFLSICLGMQLLFERSEEGQLPGLGLIRGGVTRFDFSSIQKDKALKIPHIGWNIVNPTTYNNIFAGLEDEARFYFVHSYHVNCYNSFDILATAKYGYEFTCSVKHENIWGVQFHPEKSHFFSVQFFKNFLKEIGHA